MSIPISRVAQNREGRALPAESGMALILVLLILTVAMLLVTNMLKDQDLALHMTRSHIELIQAREYALSGEEIARQILFEDWSSDPLKDFAGESWGSDELFYEYDEGSVTLQIRDLQSCFNLNNLHGTGTLTTLSRTRFNQLLTQLQVNLVYAERIVDWIDGDQTPLPSGAEDYHYLSLEQPYRTGDTLMADVSELKLILDMTIEDYNQLSQHVCTLPVTSTSLNVNTASSTLLETLSPGITPQQIEQAIAAREASLGFTDLDAFQQALGNPQGYQAGGLSVNTRFFNVLVRADYNGRIAWLSSLIERNPTDGTMRIVARDFSRPRDYL